MPLHAKLLSADEEQDAFTNSTTHTVVAENGHRHGGLHRKEIESMEQTSLSKQVTVAKYRDLVSNANRKGIADFILDRFQERYITPLRQKSQHGFCIMAISCLMIEALESFWQGLPDTRGRSGQVFRHFFLRCKRLGSPLGIFAQLGNDFYYSVRCGILHQAETTNGWRIGRCGPLFE